MTLMIFIRYLQKYNLIGKNTDMKHLWVFIGDKVTSNCLIMLWLDSIFNPNSYLKVMRTLS